MSATVDMPIDEARRWLALARGDLASGHILVEHQDDTLRNVGFFAQQGAEKALKAVRAARDLRVPRVHDLFDLVADIGDLTARFDRDALATLNPWAVAGRYPADLPEELSSERAAELLALADQILALATELVDRPTP